MDTTSLIWVFLVIKKNVNIAQVMSVRNLFISQIVFHPNNNNALLPMRNEDNNLCFEDHAIDETKEGFFCNIQWAYYICRYVYRVFFIVKCFLIARFSVLHGMWINWW